MSKVLAPTGGLPVIRERLRYHLKTGRLKLVTRGVYAVVPPDVPVEQFQPDPFLVAAAVRPDGVFTYHSTLELLGAAHSAVLDLDLLQKILQCYGLANLWAATGWFLERFRKTFRVTEDVLELMAQHRPRAPQYLERNRIVARPGMLGIWRTCRPRLWG